MAYDRLEEPTFAYAIVSTVTGMLVAEAGGRCHIYATEPEADAARGRYNGNFPIAVSLVAVVPVPDDADEEDDIGGPRG